MIFYLYTVKHTTRIAPTPSGFLHPGNLYNVLFTQKVALQHQAQVILRIDDLDSARNRREFLQHIFDSLIDLEVKWDEGPIDAVDFHSNWSQLFRLDKYTQYLDKLTASGLVYACNCSRKEILRRGALVYDGFCSKLNVPLHESDVNWRIRVAESTVVCWKDEILGAVSINLASEVGDFVVRRRGGLPAYQLSSLVDDVNMGITHIVRGDDLRQSTAMQLYLANALQFTNFEKTKWWHHPLLLNESGEKMSKSARNTENAGKIWQRTELELIFNQNGLKI